MRLFEFDDVDRTAHMTRFGNSIGDGFKNIKEQCNDVSKDYQQLILSSRGKSILESRAGKIMDDIAILFDFYNKCNDDAETRLYLDKLLELNNEMVSVIDSIK